jgi:hypothetical protein
MEIFVFAASAFIYGKISRRGPEPDPPDPPYPPDPRITLKTILNSKAQSRAMLPEKRKVTARKIKALKKEEKKVKRVSWISRFIETLRVVTRRVTQVTVSTKLFLFEMILGRTPPRVKKKLVSFREKSGHLEESEMNGIVWIENVLFHFHKKIVSWMKSYHTCVKQPKRTIVLFDLFFSRMIPKIETIL